MPRFTRIVPAAAVLAVAVIAVGCTSARDTPQPDVLAVPASDEFVVGTVAAAGQGYVDALAGNFVDGGRLVARLDEPAARCVAERWVAVLNPVALAAGGRSAEAMRSVTLDGLRRAVSIDRPMAEAMTDAYRVCEADQTVAFLDSLLLTSQITGEQRGCLRDALDPGLIGEITVSALVDPVVDERLTASYQRALDDCPA